MPPPPLMGKNEEGGGVWIIAQKSSHKILPHHLPLWKRRRGGGDLNTEGNTKKIENLKKPQKRPDDTPVKKLHKNQFKSSKRREENRAKLALDRKSAKDKTRINRVKKMMTDDDKTNETQVFETTYSSSELVQRDIRKYFKTNISQIQNTQDFED